MPTPGLLRDLVSGTSLSQCPGSRRLGAGRRVWGHLPAVPRAPLRSARGVGWVGGVHWHLRGGGDGVAPSACPRALLPPAPPRAGTVGTQCHGVGGPVPRSVGFPWSHGCPCPCPPAMQAPAPGCCSPGSLASRPSSSSSSSSLCSSSPAGSGGSGRAGGSGAVGAAGGGRAAGCRGGRDAQPLSPPAGSRVASRRAWPMTGTTAAALPCLACASLPRGRGHVLAVPPRARRALGAAKGNGDGPGGLAGASRRGGHARLMPPALPPGRLDRAGCANPAAARDGDEGGGGEEQTRVTAF